MKLLLWIEIKKKTCWIFKASKMEMKNCQILQFWKKKINSEIKIDRFVDMHYQLFYNLYTLSIHVAICSCLYYLIYINNFQYSDSTRNWTVVLQQKRLKPPTRRQQWHLLRIKTPLRWHHWAESIICDRMFVLHACCTY